MAGQPPPPGSTSQACVSPVSPTLPSSASGGPALSSSLASGMMSTPGAVASGSVPSQVSGASASLACTPQTNPQMQQQQSLANPSSQPSMLSSHINLQTYQQSLQNQQANTQNHLQLSGQNTGGQGICQNSAGQHQPQQQTPQSSQQTLGQTSHVPQQMLNQNHHHQQQQQQQQQQQVRQPQYSQSVQMNSQGQQGPSLQQGNCGIPRVSSAQRLLQMQQPGGSVAGMRGSSMVGSGSHFNQQLSPSLSGSLSVSSPGGMQAMSANVSIQQQQQQQLLTQRTYQSQQQQAALNAQQQQRLQQTGLQTGQLSQQNQHTLQGQQASSPSQSLPQQLHSSSRAPPYSQPLQSIGSQFGVHHLQQQTGACPRLATAGGHPQGQGPGVPSMLPGPPAPSFIGLQSPLTSPQQALQQQRMQQQQGSRLPQQTQQQQLTPQHQTNLTSPAKQQSVQQLSRLGSLGSQIGSQLQNLASAQQNSTLPPQTQSWLPTGQMKPLLNQAPSVPYHSQLQQQQLQALQQRSQQPQVSSQKQQQQPAGTPAVVLQSQAQQQQTPLAPAPVPAQAAVQQRAQGSASQRSGTPTASQSTTSGSTLPAGSAVPSNKPSDANGKILGKRSIQDLVSQVDPREKLDPDVEDVLLEIADDFVETVTSFACALAKHRKSLTLEAKDVLLHLERNWHMTIPGFGGDDYRAYKKPSVSESHKQRQTVIRKSVAAAHVTQETKGVSILAVVEKATSGSHPAKSVPPTVPVSSPKLHRVQ